MKPVLKWAGGKRQLLTALTQYITPARLEGHRYFEPFVGGGSVAFSLEHPWTTINDYNAELINVYCIIRDQPEELLVHLRNHAQNHCRDYYYLVRDEDRIVAYQQLPAVQRAARFIYLNKTCFNGLYRVNRQNHFNVPIGNAIEADIVQEERIWEMHAYLNEPGVHITHGDFGDCVQNADAGDVVYFDPPYDYEEEGFNQYVINTFDREDLQRLRDLSVELIYRGCTVIISNNDTGFVREAFADPVFDIHGIEAKRYINCKGDRRTGIREVIIYGHMN